MEGVTAYLEVSMCDAIFMKVLDSGHNLKDDIGCVSLRIVPSSYDLVEEFFPFYAVWDC